MTASHTSASTTSEIAGRAQAGRCTEANRHIVRKAFDNWSRGVGSITDIFAPDIVWRIPGNSHISKVYRSKQQFIDEVLAPFNARFNRSREPFRPTHVHAVFCDDDTVVVYWEGRGLANDGRPYENSYSWIMKLRQGKVVLGAAFYDAVAFNDLWERVRPQRVPSRSR